MTISEESFAPYRNLGGFDYLGRSSERIPTEMHARVAKVCEKHNITGLILVGATHTLTDCASLAEYMMEHETKT